MSEGIEQAENGVLTRRQIMGMAALAGGISFAGPVSAQFSLGKALKVGKGLIDAESLSDDDMNNYFGQMATDMDSRNPVAGSNDPYGQRLAALSRGLESYDGLDLDIKAYLVQDVNAFAMADGTIRVFAGLMDEFTDDEVRYVIGHEIGHVKEGHTKERMQTAMRTEAALGAASMASGTAGRLARSDLGALFTKVITSEHSKSNENEADDYAMNFMKAKGYAPDACVTALDKLAAMSGGSGPQWLSTHPSPASRANRMRKKV
ncbi:MAG: M48 family metallopeptidase [Pacificimonas sp.]